MDACGSIHIPVCRFACLCLWRLEVDVLSLCLCPPFYFLRQGLWLKHKDSPSLAIQLVQFGGTDFPSRLG